MHMHICGTTNLSKRGGGIKRVDTSPLLDHMFNVFLFVSLVFHFSMICDKLKDIRDKFFQKLTDIVPLFSNFSDLEKFFFIFRSNDYDINMCCIKGISEMYKYRNSLM